MVVSSASSPAFATPAGCDLTGPRQSAIDRLTQLIADAAALLPAQGPISAFVFLNTLQALEDLPFEEGLERGARLFGCQPYMSEAFYREKLEKQRIRSSDLAAVLHDDLGPTADEPLGDASLGDGPLRELGTRFDIRLAMLEFPLRHGPAEELRWFVAETDALTRMPADVDPAVRDAFVRDTKHWIMRDVRGSDGRRKRGGPRELVQDLLERFGESNIEQWTADVWENLALQVLWRICREGVHGIESRAPAQAGPIRHRDLLREAGGEDTDLAVGQVMIRFCAAFADQGFAPWGLPYRDAGFFRSFSRLFGQGGCGEPCFAALPQELARISEAGLTPTECVMESLELLGVLPQEWGDYIAATMLSLRGWAGLIHQMEVRPDRVPLGAPAGSTVEFLAVRLVLERLALQHAAREAMALDGPLDELRAAALERIVGVPAAGVEQRAFLLLQVAEARGWRPSLLYRLKKPEWAALLLEVEAFDSLQRRRIFHRAFERRYREQALDAFSIRAKQPPHEVAAPRFQATFCIDAREESFRRHLEEVAPDVETFAAPGFYCTPIYFRGVADAHFSTLCPIVVRPRHWVVEEVVFTLEEEHRRRAKTRKTIGTASHQVHVGSRSMAGGALLTAGLGVLASVPLVARVLFPKLTASIRKRADRLMEPPPVTRLRMERIAPEPSSDDDGIGFTVDEMADFGERVLRDIGLTTRIARLVIFFGHGSYCLNNPHKAAYDCGACSGAAGGPNARALAAMLNDPRVREILAGRGLNVPRDSYFVGGEHNTCTDVIKFFDLDLLPKSHQKDVESALQSLNEACVRNAHERCRRFYSAPLNISRAAAHRHVAERSEDLAQTRPEFGNASNAVCFVGRRSRIRGLFLDRRAFLHSYDPTTDDLEATILGRILGPVVVVCSGINLQYYFSHVDPPGWGSGTKLPHNVTSLLGVMDGHSSDLRSGLPWQGVEIHEPLRCLFLFEAKPEALFKVMQRNALVKRVLQNGWGQLALLDPDSSAILHYRDGAFHPYEPTTTELPTVGSSIDWYRGWREHLGFARINPESTPPDPSRMF